MEEQLYRKVHTYITKYHLIGAGDRVLAGVSGGADSVFLFFLLLRMQKELDFQMQAVHVHHGIRPEAEKDMEYVKEICEKNQITCHVFRENIPELVCRSGMTEEEAGRKVRYDDFRLTLKKWREAEPEIPEGHFKIATAHHMGDQAETVLFQLFRGSGLTGLCGIRPENEGIIRPLLCLTKQEMEQALTEAEIPFCLDETNLEDYFSRNKIRHKILPYAEKEICEGASEHIARTAEILQEAEQFVIKETENAYRTICTGDCRLKMIRTDEWRALDPFLQKEVLLRMISEIGSGRKDITFRHLEEVEKLLDSGKNAVLSLPYGIFAETVYQSLYFYRDRKDAEEKILQDYCGRKQVPMDFFAEEKPVLSRERVDFIDKIREDRYTQYFDYDKINSNLVVRHRKQGDYFFIHSGSQKKTLKEFMIESMIPRKFRDRLWLIAEESHILWIPGYRISEGSRVTGETKNIIKLQLCGRQKEKCR